jgi:hypothetical protein
LLLSLLFSLVLFLLFYSHLSLVLVLFPCLVLAILVPLTLVCS